MIRDLFASLRLRLGLLVALALIPALILMFYSAAEQRRRHVVQIELRMRREMVRQSRGLRP